MKKLLITSVSLIAAATIVSCTTSADTANQSAEATGYVVDQDSLSYILDQQSDEKKARYQYRHPAETLAFFEVAPGMTVVDSLPGDPGWYTEILLPYLGEDGMVIGADYSLAMWPEFGGFATPEFIEGKKSWVSDWEAKAAAVPGENNADVMAMTFGTDREKLEGVMGTVDRVLFIRAMHNLHRFEDEGGYLTEAIDLSYDLLKPGGMVGIVQHRAPADAPDDWADGSNGYLKEARVIDVMENAGFEFVGSSEINANPKDQPTTDEFVWRLPPSLGTSREDAELREQMMAIGESDRMTLKFRKPL